MASLLHAKSEFSLGSGTAPPEALIGRARAMGYSTLALTDVENLSAQVRFHAAATGLGVKPITGVELRAGYAHQCGGSRAGRMVLLARNEAGYESICRVITRRRAGEPQSGTPNPLTCLEESPREVFFLSDDPRVIAALHESGVSRSDLRFLVARPDQNGLEGITAVADPDVVWLERSDLPLHRLLVAIRERRPFEGARGVEPGDRSLPSSESMVRGFEARPELLAEADRVARACSFDLLALTAVRPAPVLQAEQSAESVLAERCMARLDALGFGRPYHERLASELSTIQRLGLSGYLLIVGEIADFAAQQDIPLAGRGSAGSSLVAWLLGASQVDPLEHGLVFERFIHPRRTDLPDIDLDVASNRREELLDWVESRFGPDRVAAIAAHQTFGGKAAFAEGRKALGRSANRAGSQSLIERLIGRPRHLSVHPGGMVIAGEPLVRQVPLERAPKGVRVSQYDMTSIAALGLVKLDLLGNRALAAIAEARSGSWAPASDEATCRLIQDGRTLGCFQIETPLMRSVLRQIPIRGFEDVMAALAIVRPGPGAGEAKARFIRRARGEEPASLPHPRLAGILARSYGMPLYEEDLIRCISEMTGWSLSRSDAFRAELILRVPDTDGLEQRFLAAAERSGVTIESAGPVWNMLVRFAAYTFNKSHAASYARIAWESAFLKAHASPKFYSAVLNHYGGNYPLRVIGADAARSGVVLLGPDVNRSMANHTIEDGKLRIGLGQIRHLTARNRTRLLRERPFSDLGDLLTRVPLAARELESLVLAGACDGLAPLSAAAYPVAHQRVLASGLNDIPLSLPEHPLMEAYRRLARIGNEIRCFGLHPSGHPVEVLRSEASRAGCATILEASGQGGAVRIAAIVDASHRVPAGEGRTVQFVTLEDETGLLDATIPPGVYASLGDPVDYPGPFLVDGIMIQDAGVPALRVTGVRPFHRRGSAWQEEPISR